MNAPAVVTSDDRAPSESAPPLTVDLAILSRLLADTLAAEGIPARAEVSLTLVDPADIAALKVEHLGGDGTATDVLSFPIDGPGPVDEAEPWLVGDVVIAPEVAAAQAPDHAGTTEDELALLVVHGGLHLCGWDHATPGEESEMWTRERELLTGFGRVFVRDPWADEHPAGRP